MAKKFKYLREDVPANSTAGAGEGMGNNPATFMSRSAQAQHVNKPKILRRGRFAGNETFVLEREDYARLMGTQGKRPYHQWRRYLEGQEWADDIREFANKNPKKPVIIECGATGHMTHLRYGKK